MIFQSNRCLAVFAIVCCGAVLCTGVVDERYCADLSWQTKEPYPFVLPGQTAEVYTQWTQLSCFEYLRNATVVFLDEDPPLVVPWVRGSLTVTTGGTLQPSSSRDVNPDHDLVQQEVRYYWSVDRQILLSSTIYERLFWPYTGSLNCSSNVISSVTRSFSTSSVVAHNVKQVRLVGTTLQQYSDVDGQFIDAPTSAESTAERFPSPDRNKADLFRQELYSAAEEAVMHRARNEYERVFADPEYAKRVLDQLRLDGKHR